MMAGMGSFNIRGLTELQREMEKLQDPNAFVEACAKDLAARLLTLVIKRTPVGDYSKEIEVTAQRNSKNHKKGDVYKKRVNPSGRKGGVLRRGWISKTQEEAASKKSKPTAQEILQYANGVKISRTGETLKIEIENPVDYAGYVEYGHRTANHKGWVKGHFMMKISEQELQNMAPQILERKIRKYLGDIMK